MHLYTRHVEPPRTSTLMGSENQGCVEWIGNLYSRSILREYQFANSRGRLVQRESSLCKFSFRQARDRPKRQDFFRRNYFGILVILVMLKVEGSNSGHPEKILIFSECQDKNGIFCDLFLAKFASSIFGMTSCKSTHDVIVGERNRT